MMTITFVLPSGRKVKAKLKKQEFDKIVVESKLYHLPEVKWTLKDRAKLFWVRKVYANWIRFKDWFRRKF